jgi:hypothetical protein
MAMKRNSMKPYLVKRGAPAHGATARNQTTTGPASKPVTPARPPAVPTGFAPAPKSARIARVNDEPFIIQIGLDFGTCYAKCVCRDLVTDRAWVHLPQGPRNQPLPFLVPCSLLVREGLFAKNSNIDIHYPDPGLYHLKPAIAAVGREEWNSPVLELYKRYAGTTDNAALVDFVLAAATYLLAHLLGDIRRGIRQRLDDFGRHRSDVMLVNMAIPVADMSQPQVAKLFQDVLCRAWTLADNAEILELATPARQFALLSEAAASSATDSACYLYPEVSASVQGYVRSRSAREATYVCADVGAGTVDMSLFIFHRQDSIDCLTYLDARVLPLGSSQIEISAADSDAMPGVVALENLRRNKEQEERKGAIEAARTKIWGTLAEEVRQMFMAGARKGQLPEELARAGALRIGGGYAHYPYGDALESGFDRVFRVHGQELKPVGIAQPRDLEHLDGHAEWMKRLYVAYGLSFFRDNLSRQMYPHELADIPFEKRRISYGVSKEAITKDLC